MGKWDFVINWLLINEFCYWPGSWTSSFNNMLIKCHHLTPRGRCGLTKLINGIRTYIPAYSTVIMSDNYLYHHCFVLNLIILDNDDKCIYYLPCLSVILKACITHVGKRDTNQIPSNTFEEENH